MSLLYPYETSTTYTPINGTSTSTTPKSSWIDLDSAIQRKPIPIQREPLVSTTHPSLIRSTPITNINTPSYSYHNSHPNTNHKQNIITSPVSIYAHQPTSSISDIAGSALSSLSSTLSNNVAAPVRSMASSGILAAKHLLSDQQYNTLNQSEALSLANKYQAAQRYKSNRYFNLAMILIGLAIISYLITYVFSYTDMDININDTSISITLTPYMFRIIGYIIAVICLLFAGSMLTRYYMPLPSLDRISHKHRKLLALPYDETEAQKVTQKSSQITQTEYDRTPTTIKNQIPDIRRRINTTQPSTPSTTLMNQQMSSRFILSPTAAGINMMMTPVKSPNRTTPSQQYQSSSPFSSYSPSSVPHNVPPYQPSVRSTPPLVRTGSGSLRSTSTSSRYSVEDERSDSESQQLAQQLYLHLHIETYIDLMAKKMRQWISNKILQPLVSRMNDNRRDMQLLIQQVLTTQSLRDDERLVLKKATTSTGIAITGQASSYDELTAFHLILNKYPNRVECERYRRLQRYVHIHLSNTMNNTIISIEYYVQYRLIQLAQRSDLSLYIWNGGGMIDGQRWNSSLPTDAHVIAHLLLTYFDELYPRFITSHYVDHFAIITNTTTPNINTTNSITTSPSPTSPSLYHLSPTQQRPRSSIIIHQTRAHTLPPYYMLIVSNENNTIQDHRSHRYINTPRISAADTEEWRIEVGRDNLFHCFILFFWFIRIHLDGRIGSIRLTDRACEGLIDVLTP